MNQAQQAYKLYSSLGELEQSKYVAEIDLGALRRNYRDIKATVAKKDPKARILAVVKAEAYGHGAPECVRTLLSEGCDFFAVSCIDEAVAVRTVCDLERKQADILILGYTKPSLAIQLARFNIIQALLSEDYAASLQAAAEAAEVNVRTHVALDTGMNRIGFAAHSDEEISSATAAIVRVCGFSNLTLEGMFTHFSNADDLPDKESEQKTNLQSERYRKVRAGLEEKGIRLGFHHVCNSAATLSGAADYFDGVRVGILLFGAHPSQKVSMKLSPVLKLKTVISHLHRLLPGEGVSYGGKFKADTERLIATVPIGYADGFLRGYSGCTASVETAKGSKKAPIVGRICMDQCMLDVTDTGARVGDTVVFFGNDQSELAEYAKRADTIEYECLCLISSRVPRRYVDTEAPLSHNDQAEGRD